MKSTRYLTIIFLMGFLATFQGCQDSLLDENAHSQLAPENVLSSEEGIESVLVSAYGNITVPGKGRTNNLEEWPTDISWQTGGGENRVAVQFINWTWDASLPLFNLMYNRHYNVIRDANIILENVDELDELPQDKRDSFVAEAKALRAWAYYRLYIYFGPTPLRTSTDDPLEMARASEDSMEAFIEEELVEAIPDLPQPGQEPNYGRITDGGAMGLLTKFYLNTKQWQKAADEAEDVMETGYYELFPDYEGLLKVENHNNSEMMLVNTAHSEGPGGDDGQNILNGLFPWGFQYWPEKDLEMQSNWNNWATQYRLYDDFYHSFHENDERQDPIMVEYVNQAGDTVDLLEDYDDATRSFKIWPDPNANGNLHNNDIPEVRYADILLSRAEALNELNGPNQESIRLINRVRNRAGLTGDDEVSMSDFNSKAELRNHILDERKWEFYSEPHRRTDLVRHGKLVEFAQDRGVENAAEYRTLYPIPQPALDSNPKLEQNPGY